VHVTEEPKRGSVRRRIIRTLLILVAAGAVLAAAPFAWTRIAAGGHLYEVADAPDADVVIVFGAQVAPGGTRPMPFLAGRLRTGAELVHAGKAKTILVSGDANGGSGNETSVMRDYLTSELGIDPARVMIDPYGLDSYDTCARAVRVYGVRRALLVTQSYHLARAVTLCRQLGMDADGVAAGCADCKRTTLVANTVRDFFACSKAALDVISGRDPKITATSGK
jgi:vancomycin permeability regulator SanA